MAHLIDKDALVAEIEKLKTIYNDDENIRHVAKYNIIVDILSFLDTLEVKDVQEEPVSDELEEVAEYLSKIYAGEGSVDPKREGFAFYIGFKNGANWQKEQMMKDATECEVKVDAGGYPYIDCDIEFYDYDKDIPLAKEGDKVKVIIVKDETLKF